MKLCHCVIILNYNDWKSCVKLINKIKNYANITNIVIVDNHSTDNSYLKLKEIFDVCNKIFILSTEQNGGYAYGNNYGCEFAIDRLNADYLTIANPDIFFTEKVMQEIIDFFQHSDISNVGAITCKMNCHSDIDLPSAWKLPTYRDCILENLLLLRRILGNRTRYPDKYFIDEYVPVEVVAGSFFSMSSSTFKMIGGFDRDTFLYYEENILAKRLMDAGFTNYIINRDSYDHIHSLSIDKTYNSVKSKLDLAYKSRYLYVSKYLETKKIGLIFLKITYIIGCHNYLAANSLRNLYQKMCNKKHRKHIG